MSKKGTLICVAGWANSGDAFKAFEDQLQTPTNVIRTDVHELYWRGREVEPQSVGLSRYAVGLVELIEKAEGPVRVLGWSMGGLVGLEVANARPELISKLLLVASTPSFVLRDDFPFGTPAEMLEHFRVGLQIAFTDTLAMFYKLVYEPEGQNIDLPTMIHTAEGIGLASLLDGLTYLAQSDFRAGLNKLAMPVHFLHGREDKIISFQAAEYAQLHAPGSTLTLLNGCGHGIVKTLPTKVAHWVEGCSRH